MAGLDGYVAAVGQTLGGAHQLFGSGGTAYRMVPLDAPTTKLTEAVRFFRDGGDGAGNSGGSTSGGKQVDGAGKIVTADRETGKITDEAGRERDQGARGSGKNIDGARGDVKSIGPSTRTPAGQAALIGALDQRIARAQQVVTAANTASQRLAAQLQRVSSGYTQTGGGGGLGSVAGVGQAATSGLGSVAGVPAQFTSQAGTLPSSLGGLTQLANRTRSAATSTNGGSGQDASVGSSSLANVPGSEKRQRILALAQKALRERWPYVWGGMKPGSVDCSGLTLLAYKEAGVNIPRTTYGLQAAGQRISASQALPGDLVLCNYSRPGVPEHVQIYIGDGKVIHAPQPGENVKVSNIWPGQKEFRRFV